MAMAVLEVAQLLAVYFAGEVWPSRLEGNQKTTKMEADLGKDGMNVRSWNRLDFICC
jgi:hypothetical protein